MRLLYVTDLHGDKALYTTSLQAALWNEVSLIINGGDMLPSLERGFATGQRHFVKSFLAEHFKACAEAGIKNLFMPGNDDLSCVDQALDDLCTSNPMAINIQHIPAIVNDWTFVGFNLVTDYPFRLKDRCRRDTNGFVLPPQLGSALMSKPDGSFEEIDNWETRIASMPTLAEELAKLPRPADPQKSVYVIHTPPAQLGLDVCMNGSAVGSRAVLEFLESSNAPISLHGHIHESPRRSGIWSATIGSTLCIQPGQDNNGQLTYVVVDTEKSPMARRCMVKCQHE